MDLLSRWEGCVKPWHTIWSDHPTRSNRDCATVGAGHVDDLVIHRAVFVDTFLDGLRLVEDQLLCKVCYIFPGEAKCLFEPFCLWATTDVIRIEQ
jgi:hypothetical protein